MLLLKKKDLQIDSAKRLVKAEEIATLATASEIVGSSGLRLRIVAISLEAMSLGRNLRIAFSENTSSP